MRIRALLPLLALTITVMSLTLPGCDKLITETVNNYILDSNLAVECFKCHSNDDNIFLRPKGQWENSAHASATNLEVASSGTDCASCHSHEGFITTFDNALFTVKSFSVIGCFTCHAPHSEDFDSLQAGKIDSVMGNLRGVSDNFAITMNTGKQYFQFLGDQSIMCVHCHQAQFDPSTPSSQSSSALNLSSTWGPHYSGQADVIMGSGGYRFTATMVDTTHLDRSASRGGGCLTCHYGKGAGYKFGEHTFRLEDDSDNSQYVDNCNQPGCHSTIPKLDLYSDSLTQVIIARGDTLYQLLADQNVWDSTGENFRSGSSYSYLPDQARALYNYLLFKSDGSKGVHNPAFMDILMKESIDYLPVRDSLVLDANSSAVCTTSTVTVFTYATGMVDSILLVFGLDSTFYSSPDTIYTHFFTQAGTYDISLTAFGRGLGNQSTVTLANAVTVFDSIPIPDFTVVDTVDNMTKAFLDSSRHAIGWLWDFGDPTDPDDTSTLQIPEAPWTYSDTGTFTATLVVSNPCGDSTLQMPVVVDTTAGP